MPWINLFSIKQHFIVQMWCCCHTGTANQPDFITPFYTLALTDQYPAHVPVAGFIAVFMIDVNTISITTVILG